MFKTGLVSITFRRHAPEQIIAWVKQAGLDGIEWGGATLKSWVSAALLT